MIRLKLNCDCCELRYIPGRGPHPPTYSLNGVVYTGHKEMGLALNLGKSTVGQRIQRRECLRVSAEEAKRRAFSVNFEKPTQDERPSQILARRFERVMAKSFPGPVSFGRFPS